MAFRTETKTGARVIVCLGLALAAVAQTRTYAVHDGILRIDADSISFEARGKHAKRSRIWKYDDIQQLVLGPDTLRIVSYEDERWRFGRDRVWRFDHVPADLARDWYPVFAKTLDQRFVAALADESVHPDWQLPAKLLHGRSGSQGELLFSPTIIVYKSEQPGESRTWRMTDLRNVATSDPLDLTLTTHERTFRFQLKHTLPDARFDELWRRINETNGLQILSKGEMK